MGGTGLCLMFKALHQPGLPLRGPLSTSVSCRENTGGTNCRSQTKADHIWENIPWAVKLSASARPSLVLEASLPGKVHFKGSFFISSSHPVGLGRCSQLSIWPPGQAQVVPGLVHDTNIQLPGKRWDILKSRVSPKLPLPTKHMTSGPNSYAFTANQTRTWLPKTN